MERKKRTIAEIRDSKTSGEKMVYTSVPDYTSAQWAEAAGVDVCVVGDSLAMIAHGHKSTIPATMDMMVLHAQAVRRGAPNTFVLGCMPYQSYHTVEIALAKGKQDHDKRETIKNRELDREARQAMTRRDAARGDRRGRSNARYLHRRGRDAPALASSYP